MEFRILGPVEASVDGVELALGGPRQRALLAYLLLHRNDIVPPERLLDELWWEPPRGGVGALQTVVSRLRKLVGDRLISSPSGYSLRVDEGELDLACARAQVEEAATIADPRRRARVLRDAEALWRGEPFGGLDLPFVAVERQSLDELQETIVELRLAAELETGVDAALIPELMALVAQQPLRERLRELLMLALYRAGRQADALDVYRDTRHMLQEELGLDPSPQLRRLERAILRQEPALTLPRVRRRRFRGRVAVLAVIAAAVVAAVAATETSSKRHAAPVKPFATESAAALAAVPLPAGWVTVRDPFTRLNQRLWGTNVAGTGTSVAIRGGRLELGLAARGRVGGRYHLISASVFSQCRFDGDFDARVDYRLFEWPQRNGARAQLSAWIFPNVNSDAARVSALPGERYEGNMPTSYSVLNADDPSGTLRVLRRTARMVASVRRGRRWVVLDSAHVVGQVTLGLQLFADASSWSHQRIEVAFDNFRVSAPRLRCQ